MKTLIRKYCALNFLGLFAMFFIEIFVYVVFREVTLKQVFLLFLMISAYVLLVYAIDFFIELGEKKYGEVYVLPWERLKDVQ